MMKLKAIWFAVLSATVFFPGMPSRAENPVKASPDRFSLAVECVKRFEGWHGEKKHWPYVGWGHKVLPGERFTNSISKAQGDSILRVRQPGASRIPACVQHREFPPHDPA